MRALIVSTVAVALALLPAIAAAATCGAPAELQDGWRVAAPAGEGLDPQAICAIGPQLEKMAEADAQGAAVVRHGALVYERYFAGEDQRWHRPLGRVPHDANTLHDLRSITKSITALLVGIACDRGWLKSLDAPIFAFFPEDADLRTAEKNRITLHDLLTMTSGLAWVEDRPADSIWRRVRTSPDPYRIVLEQPLAATPGTLWNYNSGGAELVGAIVKQAVNRPLDRFADEALFEPLGFRDWEWLQLANGNPAAAGGLRLRPRDLAKIGQLVLNGGEWHGRRLVRAAWIKEMTAPQVTFGAHLGGASAYGYLWWLGRSSVRSREFDWVAGIGYGGQRLFVVPSADLVVAVTAGVYTRRSAQDLAGDTVLDAVLSAIRRP